MFGLYLLKGIRFSPEKSELYNDCFIAQNPRDQDLPGFFLKSTLGI